MTAKQRAETEMLRAKIAAAVKDGVAARIHDRLSIIAEAIPHEAQAFIKPLHDERLRLLRQLDEL
jgi:hypothetical protein